MVSSVTGKLGWRLTPSRSAPCSVSMPPATAGAPTGTHLAASRENSGPQMMTVGMATRSPSARVVPSSALTALIAISGPGCGGTRPCSTDSPASAGMAMRISGILERCVTRTITGSSSTRPISKNIGRPMITATSVMDQTTLLPPALASSVSTTRLAPPESASSLPSMAPRAISRPTSFRTPPTPSSKLLMILASSTPEARPTKAEPSTRARKGWSLNLAISTTISAMPRAATTRSWVSWPVQASTAAGSCLAASEFKTCS